MSWFKQLWQNSREKGLYYEKQAEQYLIQRGLKTIERNYFCKYGELDLIMRDGQTLVFVEVKFRKNALRGGANYALSKLKQQRLRRTISHYLAEKKISNQLMRIDYVAITGELNSSLNWFKNVY
ncbi:YraN family protein [Pseudoalteromonas shioyasakiensis]|uniref:YraN family protein n=1 Tax=Pseudoalteromonas TaxID=53246 RepID=UPI001EFEC9D3|nr:MULTISPECIES: YraN family protein [Pseudoalteromonas]MCG9709228.1 YraN family protein [Pseudoalteromonas sp. Isolate3]MCQ8881266.1 YraN family protein [Pseudoalteromonas shioyasakiensis]